MQCGKKFVFKIQNINALQLMTKIIVIFIEKYLRDYNNSHIFVAKD